MKSLLKPFLLVVLLTFSLASLAQELQVQDPYVRAVPPGSPVSAAFMELHNQGSEQRTLVAASSPVSEVVELHTHTKVDGVMQMRRVESIEVPAEGKTLLEPGGLHLMLINLKETLTPGSQVEITLTLDDGSQIELSVPVRKTQMQPMSNHQ
ncbi:copper chaperone PCu(A)C [Marinospirillum sp.]|uniref:copper chaperone PCu(A)C n=1 Tax=Marinospirillum sp. TaxID=2183934 RepID=UPI0028703818|nr:copper chaperone PCu(A)C [Marinospirillum sp.]MDR9467773.1 copper chaperone PCu(A)C [Marinospirillum sp.]